MELFVHIISQSVVNSMFTRNSVTRRESIKIVEKKTSSTVQISDTELKTDKTQLPPQIHRSHSYQPTSTTENTKLSVVPEDKLHSYSTSFPPKSEFYTLPKNYKESTKKYLNTSNSDVQNYEKCNPTVRLVKTDSNLQHSKSGKWYVGQWRNEHRMRKNPKKRVRKTSTGNSSNSSVITFKDSYTSGTKNGNRYEKGTLHYENGDKYHGCIKNNFRHGQGKCNYASEIVDIAENLLNTGKEYLGSWKNDLKHGRGVMMYFDGSQYSGEWKNGQRHGVGQIYYDSGRWYDGQWSEDQICGKGTLIFANGDRHHGSFADGLPNGFGCYYFKTGNFAGDKYEGVFSRGHRSGNGTYYRKSSKFSVENVNKINGNFQTTNSFPVDDSIGNNLISL